MQRRAQSGSRVARRKLREHAFELSFQRRHQHRIPCHTTAEAHVRRAIGNPHHVGFERVLHAGGEVGAVLLVPDLGHADCPVHGAVVNACGQGFGEARLTGHREPLHSVFIRTGAHTEEYGDVPVKFGNGIRIKNFLFERKGVSRSAPSCAAAEIAFTIQRDDGRFFERRYVVSSRRMRRVVIDRIDFCLGEGA